ncbi:MAG: CBS domain-containing protein [Myxococcales bacterium]|jgi:CBS domain-containing protein
MKTMKEGIEAAVRRSTVPPSEKTLTARDVMTTRLITFTPDQPIAEVVEALTEHAISGAPVVDAQGRLAGIVSELDCLRVIAAGAYHREGLGDGCIVRDIMSTDMTTVSPDTDLYALAHLFVQKRVRRLPVVDGRELLGQVSRRDVLRRVLR